MLAVDELLVRVAKMIRCCTSLSVLISCIAFVSQETYGAPSNYSFRFSNRAPVDYDSPNSNLWLISRGDPIPASLNQQILDGDSISTGRMINVRNNDYGLRLSSRNSDENTRGMRAPQQSPVNYVSQAPLYYNRIVTSENRRQRVNGNQEGTQTTDTVLVELPHDITEGLWVRPQSEILSQRTSLRGRQINDGGSGNIKFEEVGNPTRQDGNPEDLMTNRELTSRLPNDAFTPESEELNAPQEQYYELPYPIYSSSLQDDANINVSTNSLDLPDLYDIPAIDTSERDRKIPEYGLLTSEDIELLERLGILSSLIIDHIQPENATFNPTLPENSQREFESEPVLIDHGGQSYLTESARQDLSNLRDVVLIDIPQFTASNYHTSLPENVEIQNNHKPHEFLLSENGTENNISLLANDTNLTDRQIFEILQLLSLNTMNFFNLSAPVPVTTDVKATAQPELHNSTHNVTEQPLSFIVPSKTMETSESLSSIPPTTLLNTSTVSSNSSMSSSNSSMPSSNSSMSSSNSSMSSSNSSMSSSNSSMSSPNSSTASTRSNSKPQSTLAEQSVIAKPSVSNGRIQPRLLDKLTKRDNEIIEGLFEKATPMSKSKLEKLKKLEQPKPYIFAFKQDDGNGTLQHRDEKADSSGVVKGTYGYRDALGVYRNVSYIADNSGFHAVVKTNEPGTVTHNAADVVYMSQTPPLAALVKMMAYRKSKEIQSASKAT